MQNFVFNLIRTLPHFCNVKKDLYLHHLMVKHLLTLLFFFIALSAQGQGWERVYSGGGADEAYDITTTSDGGYIFCGRYGNLNMLLTKVDADGFLQWTKTQLISGAAVANAVAISPDSTFVIVGTTGAANQRNGVLIKTDFSGNVLWQRNLGVAGADVLEDVIVLPNGEIVAAGYFKNGTQEDGRIIKTDINGQVVWPLSFGTDLADERIYGMTQASNGDFLLTGNKSDGPEQNMYVARITANGGLAWENEYIFAANSTGEGRAIIPAGVDSFVIGGYVVPPAGSGIALLTKIDGNGSALPIWMQTFSDCDIFYDIATDGNNGFMATGLHTISPLLTDLYVAKINAQGTKVWSNIIGKPGVDVGNGVVLNPEGGAAVIGFASPSTNIISPTTYTYMVRTDAAGNVFTNYIQGNIYNDLNEDCQQQPNEPRLKNWVLELKSPDFTRYATTDANGNYFIMVDTGVYELRTFAPNNLWEACNSSLSVSILNFFDTTDVNVGMRAAFSCPYNEVDIQTPILRRCTDNVYTVRYCNSGTAASLNTKIKVHIDPALTLSSSSLPYTIEGDSALFDVGLLLPGDCRSFTFTALLDCDTDLNTAHCASARIEPNTFCNPSSGWDGNVIEARARCENGMVKLGFVNKSAGTVGASFDYVIVEDVIMLTVPQGTVVNLQPGAETVVFEQLANGRTYRLIGEQTENYPGRSVPTAAIEGCVTDTTSVEPSTGFYTMFPEDDAEPFAAMDCQETYDTDFNPVLLKRGHPKGYQEQRFIAPGTDIDYLIRFVNTQSDTVQQVIVRDTLSPWLDLATIRPGTASHPYQYELYGNGIVQFTLSNINLSPVNGTGVSEGYVKFRVSQKPEIPCNTEILNRAAIYYDFNAPESTNETLHTVCELDSFVIVQTTVIHVPGAQLRVYPNPFASSATFELIDVGGQQYHLELIDLQGRSVFNRSFTDPTIQLLRQDLPAGTLFYRLSVDGQAVATGKLLVLPE
jgi:hypothetical protein